MQKRPECGGIRVFFHYRQPKTLFTGLGKRFARNTNGAFFEVPYTFAFFFSMARR